MPDRVKSAAVLCTMASEFPMRLTCPGCKAQYEVADSVIPPAGRDVQCSSCGTTWFQYPATVALQMRAADLDDDDDEPPVPVPMAVPASAPVSAVVGDPVPAAQRIDRTVLDVLRQEAEREIGERRRIRPEGDSDPDPGLVTRPRPRADGATPRQPITPVADSRVAGPAATVPPLRVAAAPGSGASRRNLLPDVEELSSTLKPAQTPAPPPSDATAAPVRPGQDFRRGLSAVLLVATVLAGLYVLAPGLADMVPALAGPLAGYVAMIDSLRQVVAGLLGAA
jgi:predicted Zn finger-like uncharacterized protein